MSATGTPLGGDVSRFTLWFGLVGGGLAWLVHLTAAYVIAEFGCVGGLGHESRLGISLVAWLLLGLTALTALVSLTAAVGAHRAHRKLREPAREAEAVRQGSAYLAASGVLASGLFTFAILFESIPIFFYLQKC